MLNFSLTSKTYIYLYIKKAVRILMIRCLRCLNLNAVFTFGMCQKKQGFASLDGILPNPIYSHIYNKFYLDDWCSAMRGINMPCVLNIHFYLNFGSPFFNEPFFEAIQDHCKPIKLSFEEMSSLGRSGKSFFWQDLNK